jgi:molybdate transport system substrate-binding protein
VAANAQFAARALKKAFEEKYPARQELIVSSSGKLTAQIEHGAPYDVFLSADMHYPEVLYRNGMTRATPRVYALGSLVIWTLKNIPRESGPDILMQKDMRTIAIANPATAPYGTAALEALKNTGLYDRVKNRIVYGESIAQVNQYLMMGTADVVFTARSVVEDPKLKNKGTWIPVKRSLYKPIAQGAVILKAARGSTLKAATAFYLFLFSEKGRSILKAYGYRLR